MPNIEVETQNEALMNGGDFQSTRMGASSHHVPISQDANSINPTELETHQEEPMSTSLARPISSQDQTMPLVPALGHSMITHF